MRDDELPLLLEDVDVGGSAEEAEDELEDAGGGSLLTAKQVSKCVYNTSKNFNKTLVTAPDDWEETPPTEQVP